jgi:hypothetical protein
MYVVESMPDPKFVSKPDPKKVIPDTQHSGGGGGLISKINLEMLYDL